MATVKLVQPNKLYMNNSKMHPKLFNVNNLKVLEYKYTINDYEYTAYDIAINNNNTKDLILNSLMLYKSCTPVFFSSIAEYDNEKMKP
eukprot:UN01045